MVRDYIPADRNFILATWLKGLYYGNTWFSDIPKDIFMTNYHGVLTRILDAAVSHIKIACLKDDPEVILGYSVFRAAAGVTVLDYLFVKSAWRRIGIARSLLPSVIHAVTHMTKLGKTLKPKEMAFNPFLIT